jgi:glycosyl transferase family 87
VSERARASLSGSRLTLAGCLALAGSFAVTLWLLPWSDERINDLFVFRTDAAWFLDGLLPYRDVLFEYPPLAAPPIALAGLGGTDASAYRWGVALMMFAAAVAVLVLVRALARRTGGDERLAVAAVALSPLLTGAMIRNHFDMLPVALTLAALLLVVAGREVAAFGVLGVAIMTKGFPLVVAPVALASLVGRGDRRTALKAAVALGAVVIALAASAVAISPSGALDSVQYQTERPVQVESLPSLGVRLVEALGGPSAVPEKSYRSDGLVHPYGGAFTAGFAALGAAAVVLLAFGAARGRDARALVLASLGAVAAFATFGKVLSPQYLVWLVPLGALALAWRRWALAGAVAVATLLTFMEFPSHYAELTEGGPYPLVLVAVRDAVLVAVVALAVWEAVPRPLRRPARESALST